MNYFYFPQLTQTGGTVTLQGDEARHITSARRLNVGNKISLFDGKGVVADAVIDEVHKNELRAVLTKFEVLQPPEPRLILASAIPKGERVNTLLDMSTQLGMSDFVPLLCERSVTRPGANRLSRFERICINACKQSRRIFVPEIHAPAELSELLENRERPESVIIVADPDGQLLEKSNSWKNVCDLILLIGPEGGFSETEQKMLSDHNVIKIKLANSILRIETACVSLLSQINFRHFTRQHVLPGDKDTHVTNC